MSKKYYVALDLPLPGIREAVDNLEDAKALVEIFHRQKLSEGKDWKYIILTEVTE